MVICKDKLSDCLKMESFFICFSVLVAIFMAALILRIKSKSAQKLPPSPWKLPIIGHLQHLAGGDPPHYAFRKLSQKHGPLIHLQLGEIPAILVSSARLVKEIMKTHDIAFSNRGEFLAGKILSYNCADVVCAPYGEDWRQNRKICTLELLSAKRVKSYGSIRQNEALHLIKSIQDLAANSTSTPINMREKLEEYTSSMVVKAAFGNVSKSDQNAFLELMKEFLPFISAFEIADLFPSLKILHPFFSHKSQLMMIRHKLDRVLDSIIDQHSDKLERSKTSSSGHNHHEDLIDVLLGVNESSDLQIPLTKNNIKGVLINIFTGGTETSSSTVEWAMAELIRHPQIMSKAQREIRAAFGGKKTVEEAEIQELRYLKLVVKETLRLHPPGPLLIPRECGEECEVDGYKIPVKTRVIVNAWAIGRDPEYWEEPESFKPERFEKSDTDFLGSHFEFIPFGAGRRMCPGISFGLANIYLPLAVLLYHFDWKLPNDLSPNDLDMTESVGMAASRTNHLLLQATLYDSSSI